MKTLYVAQNNSSTSNVKHSLGTLGENGEKTIKTFSVAERIEISIGEDGVSLVRFDQNGSFCGDTWHQTIEQAMDQAEYEFKVSRDDWQRVMSP
jgi:hypothetical protein